MLLKGKRLYLNGNFSFQVAKGDKLLMPHPAKGFIGLWRYNLVENGLLYYVLNDETVGFPEKPYFKLHWDFYNTYKTEKIYEYDNANFTPGLYRDANNNERWGYSSGSDATRAKIDSTNWIYSMPTDALPEGKYYIEWTVTYGDEVYQCEGYNGIYNIWIDTGNNRWAQGSRESAVPEEDPNQPVERSLPSGYTSLEYLENPSTNDIYNSTRCVDLGIIPTHNTKVEIKARWYDGNDGKALIGYSDPDDNNDYRLFIDPNGILYYDFGSGRGNANNTATNESWIDKDITIVIDSQKAYIEEYDLTIYLDVSDEFTGDKNIWAFGASDDGGHDRGRIYYIKIWNNDTLVRDCEPANNGEVDGLYDYVNETFLPVYGTPAVEPEEPTLTFNDGIFTFSGAEPSIMDTVVIRAGQYYSTPEDYNNDNISGGNGYSITKEVEELLIANVLIMTEDENYNYTGFTITIDAIRPYLYNLTDPHYDNNYLYDENQYAEKFTITYNSDYTCEGIIYNENYQSGSEEPTQDEYTLSYHNDGYFGYCAALLQKNGGNFTTAPDISYTYKLYEYSPTASQANGFTLAGSAGNLLAQMPTEHAITADPEYGLYYQDSNWNQVENWNEATKAFLRLGLNEGAAIDNVYGNGYTIVNAEGNELSLTELENLPNEAWAVYTFKSGSQEFDYANLVTIEKNYYEDDGWYVTLTWKDRAFVNWNIPEGKEITLTVTGRPTTTATTSTGAIQYWAGENMTASYTAPSGEYGRFNINDEDYAKTVNPTFTMEEWRWLMGGEQIRLYAGTDEQLNLNISFTDRDGFSGTINNNLYQSDTRLQFNIEDKLTIGRNISDETAMNGKYVKYVLYYTDADDNDHTVELNQDEQEEAVIYMKKEYNSPTLSFQRMLKMLWTIENEKAVFYNRDGNLYVEEAAANVEFTVFDEQQHGYNVNVGTYTMTDNGKIEIPLADIRNALVNDFTFLDDQAIPAGTWDVMFKPHVKNENAGWDPWCDYYFQMNEYGNWKLKVTWDDSFAAEWILVTPEE